MDYEESLAWLKGERSMCNLFLTMCDKNENANLITAQADAAMCQQAYWVVRAHKENLTV